MKFIASILILSLVLASCGGSDKKEESKGNPDLVGLWSLQAQSFVEGGELEADPKNAVIKLEILEDGTWRTLYGDNEVSSGSYAVEGDKLTFNMEKSQDPNSYKKLELKYSVSENMLEIEGEMYFDEGEPGYMHATFVK